MPRVARICAINYPHHITQRGNNKGAVFFENVDKEFYLKTLRNYSRKWSLEIWAYCLMINHVHILAVPGWPESLARGMGCTNLVYTQYINCKYNRSGRLWQNRFFSAIIEKEQYLWAAIRYIERNPVRANIVKNAADYQWSSAKAHVLGKEDHVLSDNEWMGMWADSSHVYRQFLMDENKDVDTSIRKATSTGRPLGSKDFIRGIENILERSIIIGTPGRPRK